MAKQATPRQSSDTSGNGGMDQFAGIANLNGAAMTYVQRCGQTNMEHMAKLGDELSSFFNTRIRHDTEFGQSLSQCRNFGEIMELQRDWFATMTNEYTEETQRLLEMTSKMWAEGLQPFYDAAEQMTGAEGKVESKKEHVGTAD